MTGIIVSYRTPALLATAYNSVRRFHPTLPLVIVDGSPKSDPCNWLATSLRSEHTTVYALERNIGHGLGMHYAIEHTHDEQLLLIDSDIEMLASPVQAMTAQLGEGVYAVGEQYFIGRDGLHRNPVRDLPYIRPYFMLLSRTQYYRYHRFIHHGSPCIKAMLEINAAGLSDTALRPFDLANYIRHDWGGTRKVNTENHQHEIPNTWETIT